ncbi:MAG: DUF1553 domain-containing protein, partial [Pirellulaceae bacterium]
IDDAGYELPTQERTIKTTRTNPLSTDPNDTNRDDATNFSRALVQRLPAEKLLDAQCQVLDAPAEFGGYPAGTRAGQLAGVRRSRPRSRTTEGGDRFLRVFGKPERLLACECERSNDTALAQAFTLISGDELQYRLTQSQNRLARLAVSGGTDAEVVEELYWTALARPPSEEELVAALELFQLAATDSQPPPEYALLLFLPVEVAPPAQRVLAIQDLAWALLNAKEFVFRN